MYFPDLYIILFNLIIRSIYGYMSKMHFYNLMKTHISYVSHCLVCVQHSIFNNFTDHRIKTNSKTIVAKSYVVLES